MSSPASRLAWIDAIKNLLMKAAWAPVTVLILHSLVARTSFRKPLDFTIHFLGGASIAFFLFHALRCFERIIGANTTFGRYLFSFALACTVGLFWEFAELYSDVFRHTHIQQSISETMSDLIADATGATAALSLVFIAGRLWGGRAIKKTVVR